MSWLDVVRGGEERPIRLASLWSSVTIHAVTPVPAAIEELLGRLRKLYVGGGAVFGSFDVCGSPEFDALAARARWKELDFFRRFLSSDPVRSRFSEVIAGAEFDDGPELESASSLTLDGELARMLVAGGAYVGFEESARRAKEIGVDVCRALFEDRFLEVEVFHSREAWSPWFQDVAWDRTWLVIDKRLQRVSLLCATDTD